MVVNPIGLRELHGGLAHEGADRVVEASRRGTRISSRSPFPSLRSVSPRIDSMAVAPRRDRIPSFDTGLVPSRYWTTSSPGTCWAIVGLGAPGAEPPWGMKWKPTPTIGITIAANATTRRERLRGVIRPQLLCPKKLGRAASVSSDPDGSRGRDARPPRRRYFSASAPNALAGSRGGAAGLPSPHRGTLGSSRRRPLLLARKIGFAPLRGVGAKPKITREGEARGLGAGADVDPTFGPVRRLEDDDVVGEAPIAAGGSRGRPTPGGSGSPICGERGSC